MKRPVRTKLSSFLLFAAVVVLMTTVSAPMITLADTLELKNGQIIQGRFLGGSTLNIRFEVDGKEQIFPTKEVLNIGFDETASASKPAAAAPVVAAPAASAAASQPAPSGGPAGQAVTIPAGTSILVRMIDTVDSSTNRIGDPFHASLESPLTVGDTVVAPKGADVYGKLAQAKEAGKISGSAQLTLELTGIRIHGNIVPVDSTDYDVAGKGRGKQSAERIGGGAAVGALIGALAGGGKGAAVGATVGAGAGTAAQVLTHGEKVRIPSETLLEFKLQQDVMAPVPGSSN